MDCEPRIQTEMHIQMSKVQGYDGFELLKGLCVLKGSGSAVAAVSEIESGVSSCRAGSWVGCPIHNCGIFW